MSAAVLLALAERCERERPTRKLDGLIAKAIGWKNVHSPMKGKTGGLFGRPWRSTHTCEVPRWTDSLDAAVTLVPDGWHLHSSHQSYGGWSACLHRMFGSHEADEKVWRVGHHWPKEHMTAGKAKAEPMARCAAALRARAAS